MSRTFHFIHTLGTTGSSRIYVLIPWSQLRFGVPGWLRFPGKGGRGGAKGGIAKENGGPGLKMSSWVVVSNMSYFHSYLGKISILTNIFERGWNHQQASHFKNGDIPASYELV